MSLRHAVMGLLSLGPASGYDLAGAYQDSLEHVWYAPRGKIYQELAKLAGEGLVVAAGTGPRGRREYELTAAGAESLRRWLTETVESPVTRSELSLRAFLLPTLPPADAMAVVRRDIERWTAEERELRDRLTGDSEEEFGLLATELVLRVYQALLGWGEWATGHLRESARTKP